MKTIAVALQKGGTGKTTTMATLAHALAMTDPHCQAFIEAIADVLVYLAQREPPNETVD